jgi:hypothetical protein
MIADKTLTIIGRTGVPVRIVAGTRVRPDLERQYAAALEADAERAPKKRATAKVSADGAKPKPRRRRKSS